MLPLPLLLQAPSGSDAGGFDFAGVWSTVAGSGVDGVGLALVALFALLGIWRGLWWQAVRLLGVLGAVVAARTLGPRLAEWVAPRAGDMDPTLLGALAWFGVFLGGLILVVLVGRLGKSLLEALHLGLVDRFGGAVAGVLTALVLHAVGVAFLLQITPRIWAAEHLEGTRSERLVDVLGEKASLLFDARTALAIERRLQGDGAAEGGVGSGDVSQPAAPTGGGRN
ncbi:CvpA family protein [Engelhardtia mirabilis]|uniref:Colicin V production protein n=1 Tax=Engelhardtia mirabilis TaxID=2528011 RepID=A0A518BKP7_9BACT|nr:Colicin V production protein [Planctomycetes bacterium Pla133]QDV01868.1 Colicin V production protein [Planctomycetes bacterium Pla86]